MKFKDHMIIINEIIKVSYKSINYKKLYNTLNYLDQNNINPYTLNEIELFNIYNNS